LPINLISRTTTGVEQYQRSIVEMIIVMVEFKEAVKEYVTRAIEVEAVFEEDMSRLRIILG